MSFAAVLVANRGEIALRVIRSARAAGLRTVAVYSDADIGAPHVRAADVAVRIGPPPAAESYLSVPALLAAAERTGADAVHPGYGFLSEHAAFARACRDAGLVFIGPPAEVIERMGRKDQARQIAISAGVPVLPAIEEDYQERNRVSPAPPGRPPADGGTAVAAGGTRDDARLAARAIAEIGFPLLVKAAAGGGGKGMRVVRRPGGEAGQGTGDGGVAAVAEALAAARREARGAFGDDALLIERYVTRGRHVEVQVLADSHGNVVHLFERDCSVQRRHQKVVEEAPARTVPVAVREALTSAAVRLARAVGYVNAGTVEFLVDGGDFYFLEMNTRLQVEHPVTELITGLDLVALQLGIAAGRPLPLRQEDVTSAGHAIEARVYAEDPDRGFLPQAGRATLVRWPEPALARVDAALEAGAEVTTWYDPMLAKVIAAGPDREAARAALAAALDETAILGLTTNTGFLRRLVASGEFRDAAIDTAWLDRNPGAFPAPPPDEALLAAAWTLAAPAGHGGQTGAAAAGTGGPFEITDGWRLSGPAAPALIGLRHGDAGYLLRVDVAGETVTLGGRRWRVRAAGREDSGDPGRLLLEIDGVTREAQVEVGAHGVAVAVRGQSYDFGLPDPAAAAGGAAAAPDGEVAAPMPGTVLAVRAEKGQVVAAGAVLGVLEAMKMELPLTAPLHGIVAEVAVAAGDRVALGQRLFSVLPGEPGETSDADETSGASEASDVRKGTDRG